MIILLSENDITDYLKRISNFTDITHTSICDYCRFGYPIMGGNCYCNIRRDMTNMVKACEDIELGEHVRYDRKLLCRICSHRECKFNNDYDLYIIKCALDIDPEKCTGKDFIFKEDVDNEVSRQ